MQGQLMSPMQLNGKISKMYLNGGKLAGFMFMKIFCQQGVVCPCHAAIYMDTAIIF